MPSRLQDLGVAGRLVRLAQFFTAQGITLLGNLLYGLLCIRLLPVADYAKFVVLFGVQGTLIVLMDVNFSGTLIPIVGEHVHNRQLIADTAASLRRLSIWAYVIVGCSLALVYPFLVRNRGWGWVTVAGMVATLLLSTWFMRVSAVYGTVLVILGKRRIWYRGQMISSLGTLALLGAFWEARALVAFSAILINVSGFVFLGVFYHHHARRSLGVSGVVSAQKRKAIIRLASPNIPQAFFYAIQGQVPLLFITYFGHIGSVASIGALGRLGQIFAVFGQLNPIFIEPYFARLPKVKLKRNYFAALLVAVVVCLTVGVLAAAFPNIFLWILGPKYSNLHYEVVVAICTSAISTFSGVLWAIHSARRFIYWWTNISGILLIFVVQTLFFFRGDLSSVRTVLYLNLATNIASLLVNLLAGIHGFLYGERLIDPVHPVTPDRSIEGSGYNEISVTP